MGDRKQARFDAGDGPDLAETPAVEFPSTRYQGSKRKILDWLWDRISSVEFDSLLDAFGGTAAVSHRAKQYGKRVVYNDYLRFNHQVGLALVENDDVTLADEDVDVLLAAHDRFDYPTVVQDEFAGLYYTDEENRWLDRMRVNVEHLDDRYERAIAYAALGQACLAKRPYNLFHRANLSMRTRDVERSFGNKATWETPFEEHFRSFVEEFNDAVFANGRDNRAYNEDVLEWESPPDTDLVYLDPPYYDRTKSNGATDYQFYYHFLEGYLQYDEWPSLIDESVKTKRLDHDPSPWTRADRVRDAFERLFDRFSDRAIALSYNSAGLPTPEELVELLETYKRTVRVEAKDHQYALSTSEDSADELLFLAHD